MNYCILSCWAKCNIPLTWTVKLDQWVECVIATFGHFISYIFVGMWLIYKQASTCLCVHRHDIQGCRGNGEQQGHWSCHRQRALSAVPRCCLHHRQRCVGISPLTQEQADGGIC